MATIANLDVNLRARTEKFDKPVQKSQSIFGKFTQKIQANSGLVKTAIAGVGAAAATNLVKGFASAGDEIDKIGARTRLSIQDVQSLSFAFQQNGGSAQQLESSINRLNINLLDLQRGTQTAKDNFKDLGLSFSDLQGLDTGDRFRKVVEALKGIKDESLQSGLALKLFGRSGAQILPLLDNVGALEAEFKKLGLGLSGEQVASAAALTDQFNKVRLVVQKLAASVAGILAPAFELLNNTLVPVLSGLADFVSGTFGAVTSLLGKGIEFFLTGSVSQAKAAAKPPAAQVKQTQVIKKSFDDGFAKSDKNQMEMVSELKQIKAAQLKLPPLLERGSSATISFLNKLNQSKTQERIANSLEKLNDTSEGSFKELKRGNKIRRQRPISLQVGR